MRLHRHNPNSFKSLVKKNADYPRRIISSVTGGVVLIDNRVLPPIVPQERCIVLLMVFEQSSNTPLSLGIRGIKARAVLAN